MSTRLLLPRRPPRLLRTYTTHTSRPTPETARIHCTTFLSKHDHASLLLTAFHPPRTRDAHLALRAFNLETALIDSQTSTPTLGALRLQFWRNTITTLFSTTPPPAEPIATLLHKVIHTDSTPFTKSFFLKILSTREKSLGGKAFTDLEDLENYAEGTYGSLHYLSLEAAGAHETSLDHIGSHIGKAAGIVSILRGIPIDVGRNHVVLPVDVLAKAGVSQEEILRRGPEAGGV